MWLNRLEDSSNLPSCQKNACIYLHLKVSYIPLVLNTVKPSTTSKFMIFISDGSMISSLARCTKVVKVVPQVKDSFYDSCYSSAVYRSILTYIVLPFQLFYPVHACAAGVCFLHACMHAGSAYKNENSAWERGTGMGSMSSRWAFKILSVYLRVKHSIA